MKRLVLVLFAICSLLVASDATAGGKKKADKDTDAFRYDIEYIKTSGQGIVNVMVWTYSKDSKVALEQCRKSAVHGVIFKGYAGGSGTAQPALVRDMSVEQSKAEFFNEFFDGGRYNQYITNVDMGTISKVQCGKEYKVGVVVSVNKSMLRHHLESAGVVRGLSSGF